MTEITRVPLQPIRKGSLAKLWLGVVAVVLVGAGIAWGSTSGGVRVTEITAGTGGSPTEGQVAIINYVGKLANGKTFDQAKAHPMLVGPNIPGFDEGLRKMHPGGSYRIEIPSDKAYGAQSIKNPQTGVEVIPANSDLTFEVELIDFMSREDFEQRMQALQLMMQMQQQAPGGQPGAPPPMPMPGQ